MGTGILTGNMSVQKAIDIYREKAAKLRERAKLYERKAKMLENDLLVANKVETDEQPSVRPTIGEAARDILRQAGKPMHALHEIYPQIVQQGIKANKAGLQTILGRTAGIHKVPDAPNTWVYAEDDGKEAQP